MRRRQFIVSSVFVLLLAGLKAEAQFEMKFNTGHGTHIDYLDVSADDQYLLTLARASYKLWEVHSGREIWSKTTTRGATVRFLENQKFFLKTNEGFFIKDLVSGETIDSLLSDKELIRFGSLHLDLGILLTYEVAVGVTTFRIRSLHDFTVIREFRDEMEGYRPVEDLALSKDGNFMAVAYRDPYDASNALKEVKYWDLNKMKLVHSFSGRQSTLGITNAVHQLLLSDDLQYLVAGYLVGHVEVWHIPTGKKTMVLNEIIQIHEGIMAINNQTNELWIGDMGVYDLSDGKKLKRFTVLKHTTNSLGFSKYLNFTNDYKMLTYAKTNEIRRKEITSDSTYRLYQRKNSVIFDVSVSKAYDKVYVGTERQINVIDYASALTKRVLPYMGSYLKITSSPEERLFRATGSELSCFETKSDQLLQTVRFDFIGDRVSVSDDGDHYLVGRTYSNENADFSSLPESNTMHRYNLSGSPYFYSLKNSDLKQKIGKTNTQVYNMDVSSDGKRIALRHANNTNLEVINPFTNQVLHSYPGNSASFSKDGTLIAIITSFKHLKIYKTGDRQPLCEIPYQSTTLDMVNRNGNNNLLFTADNKFLLYALESDIMVWDIANNRKHRAYSSNEKVTALDISPDGKRIIAGYIDGEVKFWNWESPGSTPDFTVHSLLDEADWLVTSQAGANHGGLKYYSGTKNVIAQSYYVNGLTTYGFDQFDLIYNRPDIILQKIGKAPPAVIQSYKKAYIKRLKQMGFNEERINDYLDYSPENIEAPELTINTPGTRYVTTDNQSIEIDLEGMATGGHKLERLLVTVNGVPIFDVKGKEWPRTTRHWEKITVDLTPGKNTIGIRVMNDQGVYSFEEVINVVCHAKFPAPNLYLVSIGVSTFEDSDYDLTYAAKDATDFVNLFRNSGRYGKIAVIDLQNETFVKQEIKSIKDRLMKTAPQDHVMIFYAGHGLLDANYDFYLTTYDTDFSNPGAKALPYDELEDLLAGIPARNKLMFIDACHSGEVDKEELEAMTASVSKIKNITFRGFNEVEQKENKLGLPNSFELMKQLFNDVRSNTGAAIISSASGLELAFESSEWKNGVFTYAILEGIKNKSADLDKNGKIKVSELKDFVFDRVSTLTDGQQNPTSRRENLENDFVVWEY